MELLVLTGLSGAGKTEALHALEDTGVYCVDNLPVELLPALVSSLQQRGIERVGLGLDVRLGQDSVNLAQQLRAVAAEHRTRVLFLSASFEVLERRFAYSRREHVLSSQAGPLPAALHLERQLLAPLQDIADTFDTSQWNPQQLRQAVLAWQGGAGHKVPLALYSFSYRQGLPLDAHFVIDARGLPNPHWDESLRPLDGRDQRLDAFFGSQPEAQALLTHCLELCRHVLHQWRDSARLRLVWACGCSGGRHRSVWLAEKMAQHFADHTPSVLHRDLA